MLIISDGLTRFPQDYALPAKRRQMHLYPEFTGKRVKEAWNASKWLVDVPDAVLTPMTRIRGKDFFVNELAYCTDGSWFIPTRLFDFEGALWEKGYAAMDSAVSHGSLHTVIHDFNKVLCAAGWAHSCRQTEHSPVRSVRYSLARSEGTCTG